MTDSYIKAKKIGLGRSILDMLAVKLTNGHVKKKYFMAVYIYASPPPLLGHGQFEWKL